MKRIGSWVGVLALVALIVTATFCSRTEVGSAAETRPAATASAPTSADLDRASRTFVDLSKRLSPSVVNIYVTQVVKGDKRPNLPPGMEQWWDFFGPFGPNQRDYKRQGQGSGFIVDPKGLVVTNGHVVEGADKIRVKLVDGREFDAKVVGTDTETDVALIRIEKPKDLAAIPLGDSDKVDVGEWVLAIGNPFGFSNTVTAGIVSAKGRQNLGPTQEGPGPTYQNFIQTDASINPGNSGGPLINVKGEVIGINTMIAGIGTGIGFAIPINMAKSIVGQLETSGRVTRGWLGVGIQDVTPEMTGTLGLGERKGVLIGDVFADGPAAKAGVQVGDVVVAIDGKPVATAQELQFLVAEKPVGASVAVQALRKGKEKTFDVKLGQRPSRDELAKMDEGGPADEGSASDLGMTVQTLSPDIAGRLGLEPGQGVVVTNVDPSGNAAEAGLRRGDVVLEANQKPVGDAAAFGMAVKEAPGDSVLLLIQRRARSFFVTVNK
jgi:serine protease Do